MIRPGFSGFEIDAPEPPVSEAGRSFYMLWGRTGYDPKASGGAAPARPVKKR
jgi:hypothetical protein